MQVISSATHPHCDVRTAQFPTATGAMVRIVLDHCLKISCVFETRGFVFMLLFGDFAFVACHRSRLVGLILLLLLVGMLEDGFFFFLLLLLL